MYAPLKQHHIEYVASVPAVNIEFADKVKELDRRLQKNGLAYKNWDTMTDHQQGIFSQGLFLDGQCAGSVQDYVTGAAKVCEPCAAEELHHHSPALMRAIDEEKEKLPNLTIKMGESLNNLNGFIDLLLESIVEEEIIQEGDTAEIDVNEIWLGYSLVGGDWTKFKTGGPFGDPKKAYEERVAEITKKFGDRGIEAIEVQKGRAEATAKEVIGWAKGNNFPGNIDFVAWTARPGALDTAYGSDTGDNPTDVLIKFATSPGDADSFLGVSAKSTKQSTGKVDFFNTGGNYINKRPFPKGLADVGGEKAWERIKEKYTQLLNQVAAESTEKLQQYGIEVPKAQGAKNTFLKRLTRTYATPEMIKAEQSKRKPASWLPVDPFPNLPQPIAKEAQSEFYKKGAEFLTFYRDTLYEVLDSLTPEQLQEHILQGVLRTDALPLCIIATGRGKAPPFTADVAENPSDPDWVKDASANGFALEKTGGKGPGIGFKTGGSEGVKIAKLRMKFATRPFASSVKPTAEGW